ncbi:MAG: translation initiation factor IF-2 [Oscillospiraceae bacterium]|nr:translation initiation factor IF-2 [Oscillospiraceae bacterium]
MQKYRVHEVAKDFGLTTKVVTDIMTEFLETPKNHMQVLTEPELNLIFDVITTRHQVESFEAFMAVAAPKKEEKKAADAKPAASDQPATPAAPPAEPKKSGKITQVHHLDTRGSSVDLSKYDDHAETLVPDKAKNMSQGKEKFKKNNKNQQGLSQKRRMEEQEKMKRLQAQQAAAKKQQLKITIPDEIAVGELASRLKRTGADVVKELIKAGIMASVSQVIDYDTAALIAMEMGAKVEREVVVTIEERLIDVSEDAPETLRPRDPVVVVMGHVDHGKTSLLDAIRSTNVVSGEAGGITQHIGAYRVELGGRPITFLDTPGHAAFTSMRARGAKATDVAILVVAADDGIMPQTIEAISHAKAANIPIVVAVNKMDKEGANPDRIMQQLTEHELVPEEWGGSTIVCKISAKQKQGIDELLEMVLLTSDMLELKANPDRRASGTVIEAKLDRGRGPVATLLVQNGTLKSGDVLIAGTSVGRVRAMTNDKGAQIKNAGPSVPVEVIGLSEVPSAGDLFYAVEDERMARELVEQRKAQEKDAANAAVHKVSLEDLFSQIEAGTIKDLNLIVKADVQGSAEAVRASLEKLSNEEVRVRVIHSGVGAINDSDLMLASASNAIIVGFNVRPDANIRDEAERQKIDMRLYRIIYDCIEEIEAAMKGMLAPKFQESVLGHAEIRQTFKASKVGTIAGCYVTDGKISRNSQVRVVRDGVVVYEGELASLKRFKDDVKEVLSGFECGLNIERFNDIKEGDIIEAFEMIEVAR